MQVPRAGAHSLGLTGRYVYFLFKPVAAKYFVVHMEAGTQEGVAVRVSFSNLFKELKSTNTWLQFPFASSSSGSSDPTPRWALLTVDLQSALATFFNRTYMCLKNVKVCANVLIKGVFTSNQEYTPHHQAGQPCALTAEPLPREMRLFLPKGAQFSDHYNSFTFPAKQPGLHRAPGTSVRPAGQAHSSLHPAAVRPDHPPTVTVTSPSRGKHSSGAKDDISRTAKEGPGVCPPRAQANTRQIVITRHGPDKQQSTSVSTSANGASGQRAVCVSCFTTGCTSLATGANSGTGWVPLQSCALLGRWKGGGVCLSLHCGCPGDGQPKTAVLCRAQRQGLRGRIL